MIPMQENIPQLIVRNRGRILIAILGAAALAAVLSLLMPKQYLSQASVLPANSKLMDKQAMFGNNIQELYSAYGASEDLDRLIATMHSPSVLQVVADSLGLAGHYAISGKDARGRTLKKLEKQVKMLRTEYGEVNLKVWDKDPAMAQRIAASILVQTQQVYDELFISYYQRSVQRLDAELGRLSRKDTLRKVESDQYQQLLDRQAEYHMAALNPPAAMFTIAKPELPVLADKPNLPLNIFVAALAALFAMIAWIMGSSFWKSAYARP